MSTINHKIEIRNKMIRRVLTALTEASHDPQKIAKNPKTGVAVGVQQIFSKEFMRDLQQVLDGNFDKDNNADM